MKSPKKAATLKPKVTFKDLHARKNPKGGDESPKETVLIKTIIKT